MVPAAGPDLVLPSRDRKGAVLAVRALEQFSAFREAPAIQQSGTGLLAGHSVIPGELSRFALTPAAAIAADNPTAPEPPREVPKRPA